MRRSRSAQSPLTESRGVWSVGPQLRGRIARGRLGIEPITDSEVRMQIAPLRRYGFELLPQLADEDIHRAIPVRHLVSPDAPVDLRSLQHPAVGPCKELEQLV